MAEHTPTSLDSPAAVHEAVAALVTALHHHGLDRAAEALRDVQRTAFTTSSEWRGELGAALRRAAAAPALPPALRQQLARVQAALGGRAAAGATARAVVATGARYFGIVFAAGFALGTIRVPFVVPRLGVRTAELLEMPIMLLVIVAAARVLVRRHRERLPPRAWLAVGVFALALLVGAELLLAAALQPGGIAAYVAGRDPVSGGVYLAMLALFGMLPWLCARRPARDR